MTRLLVKLPWFLSTPAIVVLTVALLFGPFLGCAGGPLP